MSGFFDKVRHATGVGLNQNELYNRAYTNGVNLKNFKEAADLFDKAGKKFSESGDLLNATRASANALLYRYLATGDPNILVPLIQRLSSLPEIEAIGSQTEMMPIAEICAELDCRKVEADIAHSQDNEDLLLQHHKSASEKFQAIMRVPLRTYEYRPAPDGHDKADMRHFYHSGMYQFYLAMVTKNSDPEAASDNLANANQYFRRCNDQAWLQRVDVLLKNWRISRTCWVCHREMQGHALHFTMCRAIVTPYTKTILEKLKQDTSSMADGLIAVCTPCGSMMTFKAVDEADKVRQELTAKLVALADIIDKLSSRVSYLERNSHHH